VLAPSLFKKATLYTQLFDISRIQITLIAFSLNLILNGYLSRKISAQSPQPYYLI